MDIFLSVILMLGFVWLSYALHVAGDSSLMQTNDIWQRRLDFHVDSFPMSLRYFTTESVRYLHSFLGLSIKHAFFTLQFGLYFILGLLFYRLLRVLGFSRRWATGGLIILAGSYPLLFAHFQPVYTWDDFWEYIALTGAFLLVVRRKPVLAALVFTLGAIARESILMLYPIYVYALVQTVPWKSRRFTLAALLPVIAFLLYYLPQAQWPSPSRFASFDKNFYNPGRSRNSAFSFIISFGVLWLTTIVALAAEGRRLLHDLRWNWVVTGVVYALPVVVVTTFTLGLARETRLFFPPFVFVIPLSLFFLWSHRDLYCRFYTRWWGVPGLALAAGGWWLGQWLAPLLFPQFDFRAGLEITQVYFGLHMTLSILFVLPLLEGTLRHAAYLADSAVSLIPKDDQRNHSLPREQDRFR